MANPFDDDDMPVRSYTNNVSAEKSIQDYEREIEQIMQDTLSSTQRSTAQLDNSEKLANQTAMNLLEQREKLQNAEKNLDEINHTTQLTQRSLNSLKSVFGGFFKNKFSKAPQKPSESVPQSKSANKLSQVAEETNSQIGSSSVTSGPTLSESSRNAIKNTRWEAMDNEIDENLGNMSSQLSRLKMMGQALGDEVEDQNNMLDRIQQKAERNDHVVRSQDNQMKKLLGYKPEPVNRS